MTNAASSSRRGQRVAIPSRTAAKTTGETHTPRPRPGPPADSHADRPPARPISVPRFPSGKAVLRLLRARNTAIDRETWHRRRASPVRTCVHAAGLSARSEGLRLQHTTAPRRVRRHGELALRLACGTRGWHTGRRGNRARPYYRLEARDSRVDAAAPQRRRWHDRYFKSSATTTTSRPARARRQPLARRPRHTRRLTFNACIF